MLYGIDNAARLCDVARSRAGRQEVTGAVARRHAPLAVLRDGRPITQDRNTTEVVVWAWQEGILTEQKRLAYPSDDAMQDGRTRRGVLSQYEKRLAGSSDGWLFSVDLEQGTVIWSGALGKAASAFADQDLSPDGEWIASSDFGPRISIHRFARPEKIVTFLGGDTRAYDTAVAFSRDGRRLYTGNEDGRIRVWDTANWQELAHLGWNAHSSAVSHDGTLIATSGDDNLRLFPIDPEPGELRRRERFALSFDQPANWIQFARGENGNDRALLHSTPEGTPDIWETDWESPMGDLPAASLTNLPFPLVQHGAIRLFSGKVLVAGGRSIAVEALSACHLYDPDTSTCSTTGALRQPRSQPVLTLLPNGKVLAAGGAHGNGWEKNALATCELYDPDTGMWTSTASMIKPRLNGGGVLLQNGLVLAAGGVNANGPIKTSELYDPDTATWSAAGPLAGTH